MKIKTFLLSLFLCTMAGSTFSVDLSPDKCLWYQTPAHSWGNEALHLGNGYMGASFYGGIDKECFNIAEKTFWTGGPNVTPNYNYGIKEGGKDKIGLIRQAIAQNQISRADSLANLYMLGNYDGFGDFSKVGELYLEFDAAPNTVSNYLRGLDLEHSIGFVEYDKGNVHFNREYFCSYPDKVIALHLSADKQGSINTSISQDLLYHATSIQWEKGNELIAQGVITASGLKYCVRIKVLKQGGEISYKAGKITIAKANEATILYTVSTEYDAKSTNFKGVNPFAETDKNMKIAASQSYETLKNKHISDYQALFGRVSFTLKGDAKLESLPTDQRVTQLKKGTIDDSALKTLYFNFGRYLLISASRPGTLPSTLHGVWNDKPKGSWSANYQSNINIQEMYWAAGPTQLAECQEAYIDWIEGLVEPGRKVAQAYYGTGGWVSHATGNIWKYASPGYDLLWGLYPTGSAWHCLHPW
ncbi:MAG: glycoside hydrolase family 95 protein, partial [Rikenellaceae bacterium]